MKTPAILRRLALAAGVMLGMVTGATAQQVEMNIMTGSPTGTYIQFGRDISNMLGECGQTLNVVESAGSLENFLGVRQRRNTQFGIVQNDVLEYMKTFASEDPAVAKAIKGVRIAFPLYQEEVHILGTSDLADFRSLQGKRVAIGTENSGTFLTASLMMSLAGIVPAETLTISSGDALTALQNGEIDAFFYVAGAPTKLFAEATLDGTRFHLLPINDETLRTVYSPASLPGGTYAFQTDPVDLVAVKAVLMTYEYNADKNTYHKNSCKAVSDVSNIILTRIERLKAEGHPKWKQVDLSDIPPGWDIGGCVNTGISPEYDLQCAGPSQSIESEANDAYRKNICAVLGC